MAAGRTAVRAAFGMFYGHGQRVEHQRRQPALQLSRPRDGRDHCEREHEAAVSAWDHRRCHRALVHLRQRLQGPSIERRTPRAVLTCRARSYYSFGRGYEDVDFQGGACRGVRHATRLGERARTSAGRTRSFILSGVWRVDVLHFAPGVMHGAILDEEVVLIDIFTPIREDFLPA